MLSKSKTLAKTPQPTKGKGKGGGKSALKVPKSAPQVRKKKPVEEIEIDDEDIQAMLKSLKSKGKKTPDKKLSALGKGGSEESEDEEDLETAQGLQDDDDDEDDSLESDEVDDDEDDDDDDDDEEDEGSDLEETIRTATKNQLEKNRKGTVSNKVTPGKTKNNSKKGANKTVGKSDHDTAAIKMDLAADAQRRAERDLRTLFIKHLAAAVTEESLKSLSPDIEEVRLNKTLRKGGTLLCHRGYAFLVFKDEKTAEKNFHKLQGKLLEKRKIFVDFVGAKSKHWEEHDKIKQLKPDEIDATKLYVTGFDVDMTSEKLLKLFPKAYNVTLPIHGKDRKPTGYGFVHFATEEDAKAAHDNIQDKITAGHRLTVLFAKKSRDAQKRRQEAKASKNQPAKKKAKLEAAADADDEDDDMEDDDEEGESEEGDEEDDDDDDEDDDEDEDEDDEDEDEDDDDEEESE